MAIFFFVLFVVLAVVIVAQIIHLRKHTKLLHDVAERVGCQEGEHKVVLSSLMQKFEKMNRYGELVESVETPEVRKLFGDLMNDEDRHLKLLKNSLYCK